MNVDQKFDIILTELQKTNSRLEGIEDTVLEMKQDFLNIKAEQNATNINRKIRYIAEKHGGSDIRQLESIQELCHKYEKLLWSVRLLTGEIKKIQRKLSMKECQF